MKTGPVYLALGLIGAVALASCGESRSAPFSLVGTWRIDIKETLKTSRPELEPAAIEAFSEELGDLVSAELVATRDGRAVLLGGRFADETFAWTQRDRS